MDNSSSGLMIHEKNKDAIRQEKKQAANGDNYCISIYNPWMVLAESVMYLPGLHYGVVTKSKKVERGASFIHTGQRD